MKNVCFSKEKPYFCILIIYKKWPIKPTLAGKLVDSIHFMADKEVIKTEYNEQYTKVSIRFFNDREVRAVWDEKVTRDGRTFNRFTEIDK